MTFIVRSIITRNEAALIIGSNMMTRYIAFLRGINVGGNKKVPMKDLAKLCESLSCKGVVTYIQSGNVVFDYAPAQASQLEKKLAQKIADHFCFDVRVMIRTQKELAEVVKNAPLKTDDPAHSHVIFLSAKPENPQITDLEKAKTAGEEFQICGREVYVLYPNGVGRTKLSNALFEKKLKVDGTMRNWNTVNKLLTL